MESTNTNPGMIAPHEAKEVALVLGGSKPLATLEHDKNPEDYVKAILLGLAGMLSYEVRPSNDCVNGEVIFTLPENKHLIVEYQHLRTFGVDTFGIRGYHVRMGRLFGYSEDDILAFLNDQPCNCHKCTGA